MAFCETDDGCRLYFEAFGNGADRAAIVFLGGTGQTTLHWRLQVLFFNNDFKILVYDARNQGKSDADGQNPLSLQRHVDDLVCLLDFVGFKRAHLVGLSHGAHVALAMTHRHPEKVDRLVLCSLADQPSIRARVMLRSWIEILKTGGLDALSWAMLATTIGEPYLQERLNILDKMTRAVAVRNRGEGLLAHLEAISAYPAPSQLADRIHCPTLVLSGSQDLLVSSEGARRLAEACGGTHILLEGAGHSLQVEAVNQINQRLLSFLKNSAT